MKVLLRLPFVLLVCLGTVVGEERVLQILDKPLAKSPVENTGHVTLVETPLDQLGVSVSHRDDWTIKNVSQKPIVALVETLRIGGENRFIVERKAQYDAIFHPKLLEPGQTISFSQDSFPAHAIDSKYAPLVLPACEVTVGWVQFADGTSFGDRSYADELLKNRAAIVNALQHLSGVYQTEGTDKFLQELQKRVDPPAADAYLGHIRIVQQKRGTQDAAETVEMHLHFAEQRAKLYESGK